ncbi:MULTISPECIES: hypothetical protein [Bacillus]|uniref:hypothetical protein n=1 Tax=Bacillus TaxID=1386 RepID=UPI00031DF7F1|nr:MULTISPECIES: hypothetical protein [Bacillus]
MSTEMMLSLVPGKIYRIDRGGPESRIGRLVSVKSDYFTVLTQEDDLVFYQPHHIKSITENTNQGFQLNSDFPSNLKFRAPRCFNSVLDCLVNYQVKVNRGGKESVEGRLESVRNGFITISSNDESIRISLFHIRNISYEMNQGRRGKEESGNKRESKNKQESRGQARNRNRDRKKNR